MALIRLTGLFSSGFFEAKPLLNIFILGKKKAWTYLL